MPKKDSIFQSSIYRRSDRFMSLLKHLARKRFYFKEQFRKKDIQFLCKRLGVLPFAFTIKQYRQTTYTRHRNIILKYFAFKGYQPSTHDRKLTKAIESQIYTWENNERIFKFILEWLEFRKIELPTYHNLQSVITLAIRDRNKKIRHRFNLLLGDYHRQALDILMEKQTHDGNEEYLLTSLQSLSPSDSPKQIRANMEKFQIILDLFKAVRLLMRQMNFSDNAIHYFGEFVTASEAYNLNRRADKYLYLACFCIYQRYIFEDWMVRTFLTACKSAVNRASRKEKFDTFYNYMHQKMPFKTNNYGLNNHRVNPF